MFLLKICHYYTLCWVIVFIDHTIVASIDVWQSYFAYNCCKYILHCVANSFMSQFTHFLGKIVLAQTLFLSNNCLFSMSAMSVSVMENHCSKVRGITNQVRLENEVQVAINGPAVQHCRGIVREAMRVGEGGGNFIRRSNNIKQYTVSKAVYTLTKKKPRVPFML